MWSNNETREVKFDSKPKLRGTRRKLEAIFKRARFIVDFHSRSLMIYFCNCTLLKPSLTFEGGGG
jgi:hypothetical protein